MLIERIVDTTVDMSTVAAYIAQAIVYSSIVVMATQEAVRMSPLTTPTQKPPGRLARLGDFAFRRRRFVLVAWIATLVVAIGAAAQLGGDYRADYSTPGSESKAAEQRLADRFPQENPFSVDVVWQAKDVRSASASKRIDDLLARAQKLPGIGDGVTTRDALFTRNARIAIYSLSLHAARPDAV